MVAIQEACARIGAVTRKGLAKVIKENYSKKVLYFSVLLILIANTINIGADIGVMAEAIRLIIPINFTIIILLITFLILILEIFLSYKVYSRILKWLALALLSYPLTVFLVKQPWLEILKATFIPHIELSFAFLFIITGVLGTTISPYMFFWEASEEVEEEQAMKMKKKDGRPLVTRSFIKNLRLDNFIGIDPIKALIFAAVFNGITAVPLIYLIARTAGNKKIMGENISGKFSSVLVWLTFAFMALSAITMFYVLLYKI